MPESTQIFGVILDERECKRKNFMGSSIFLTGKNWDSGADLPINFRFEMCLTGITFGRLCLNTVCQTLQGSCCQIESRLCFVGKKEKDSYRHQDLVSLKTKLSYYSNTG